MSSSSSDRDGGVPGVRRRQLCQVPLLALAMLLWPLAWAQPADAVRVWPLTAQADNGSGLSVQVNGLALHEDHTVLHVAVAFANPRRPDGAQLASHDTLLLTDAGDRLMLRRPSASPELPIDNNASMEGELTFLGALPVGTETVTLVINDGNLPGHSVGPGLHLPIALPAEVQAQLKVHSARGGDAGEARYPVQAGNDGGLIVQVKALQRDANTTRLAVSVSYANRLRPKGTHLAARDTYLQTGDGQKFMLQRLQDNPQLHVASGDTVVGELVFQGVVPADAAGLRLVINDGNLAGHSVGSGLTFALPAS